jgi:hypothetical protein
VTGRKGIKRGAMTANRGGKRRVLPSPLAIYTRE